MLNLTTDTDSALKSCPQVEQLKINLMIDGFYSSGPVVTGEAVVYSHVCPESHSNQFTHESCDMDAHVVTPSTFNHQILISSSLSPGGHLCQI